MIKMEINTLNKQIPNDKQKLNDQRREQQQEHQKHCQRRFKNVTTWNDTLSRSMKLLAKSQNEELLENIKLKERELVEANLNWEEIKWFENITTLDQLKKKVITCSYWADI